MDDQEEAPYMSEDDVAESASDMSTSIANTEGGIRHSFLWQKMVGARKKLGEFSAKYPNVIRHCITVSNSVIDFYKRGNPMTLLRGGFEIFDTIQSANLYNFYQFAKPSDGFRYLTINKINIAFLFQDTLDKFPKEKLTFKNGETCDIYHLAMGDIYGYKQSETLYIYYNQNSINKEGLTKFLVDEKFKDLNSNFLYLQMQEEAYTLTLSSWHPELLPSKKADEIKGIIQQFNDAGLHRSLLFYGVPGVGKTSAAFKVISDLNYRTIVFSASNKLCTFDLIKNLIDLLKIDAVIIDDFDQFSQTNKTLDLLEMFNKKLKVLISIANSLREMIPAIYRPGRHDDLILFDELDEECISKVLGKFSGKYLDRVRKWPIAFINELAKKGQFLTAKGMDTYCEELEKRVHRQLISEGAKPTKKPVAKKPAGKKTEKVVKVTKMVRDIDDSFAPDPHNLDVDEAIDAILDAMAEVDNGTMSKKEAQAKLAPLHHLADQIGASPRTVEIIAKAAEYDERMMTIPRMSSDEEPLREGRTIRLSKEDASGRYGPIPAEYDPTIDLIMVDPGEFGKRLTTEELEAIRTEVSEESEREGLIVQNPDYMVIKRVEND